MWHCRECLSSAVLRMAIHTSCSVCCRIGRYDIRTCTREYGPNLPAAVASHCTVVCIYTCTCTCHPPPSESLYTSVTSGSVCRLCAQSTSWRAPLLGMVLGHVQTLWPHLLLCSSFSVQRSEESIAEGDWVITEIRYVLVQLV